MFYKDYFKIQLLSFLTLISDVDRPKDPTKRKAKALPLFCS